MAFETLITARKESAECMNRTILSKLGVISRLNNYPYFFLEHISKYLRKEDVTWPVDSK